MTPVKGHGNHMQNNKLPTVTRTIVEAYNHKQKPLTTTDDSKDGQVRVAVQGAYSESAVARAYPNGERVPCDGFEAAFEATELRIADRAVLPIENSVTGSIHRIYDLLLRHRLHIVGELQELSADNPLNVTRFVMLARDPVVPSNDRPFKTSVVFAHDGGTSVLYKVLLAFAFRDIGITKIESRPIRNSPVRIGGKGKPFEYLFYLDFEASMADLRAQNALSAIKEHTSFLRVLGSYPIDLTTPSPSLLQN